MNFKDFGIIISKFPLKENSSVVTVFTKNHGIYSGVCRIPSKRKNNGLMEANLVDFEWKARLSEHLGYASCEVSESYNSKIMMHRQKLFAFNAIISLIKASFQEREPHPKLYKTFHSYIKNLSQKFEFIDYINMELAILSESGYHLELDKCGATGTREKLYYVSPKTGRAICRESGDPYSTKLLLLPQCLTKNLGQVIPSQDIQYSFDLTTYFFDRYIWPNRNMPEARRVFIESVINN